MRNFKRISAFCLLLALLSCSGEKKAKYVFFFIGDGFGLSQSILTENYLDVLATDTATVHLELMKMPVSGYSTTYSANRLITCSSAAGTALAAGVKTNNGMLGVTPDTVALTSIAELLHGRGFRVGIISSVGIDHATPAAFYANSGSRSDYEGVARQLPATGFEFFGGGGLIGALTDSTIWQMVKDAGYTVSCSKDAIDAQTLAQGKLFAISSKLCKSAEIPYVIDEPSHNMHLSYFVKKVIDFFEPDAKPFFVMVEGGKIDWSCHGNDAATTIHEVIEFDKAYRYAYEFYLRHPDQTLIVMTADHETGGMGIGTDATGYKSWYDVLGEQKMSEGVFEEAIEGVATKKNNLSGVYAALQQNFGFNGEVKRLTLSKKDSLRIENAYKRYHTDHKKSKSDDLSYLNGNDISLSSLAVKMMSEKAGVGWTTGSHTGVAVPVRAIGAGAERFAGFYDNTQIPHKILSSMGLEPKLNR